MAEYSDEIVDKILNELANSSKGLQKICKENNISTPKFREFIVSNKEAGNKYAHARSLQIECIENEITDLCEEMANKIESGSVTPDIASAAVSNLRIRVEALKWLLSKLAPKKYGDKLDVTSDNKPVQVALSVSQAKEISKQLDSEV